MTIRSIFSLDDARAANPDLGFGLYCYGPGEDMTLEIFTPDEQVFTFIGKTEADVLQQAFPPEAEDWVDVHERNKVEAAAKAPEPNIFD